MKVANIGQQALGTFQQARASYDQAQQAEQVSADSRRRTRAISKLADQMSTTKDPQAAAQATQDAGAQMAEQKQMSETFRRIRQKMFVGPLAAALIPAVAGPAMDLAKQGVTAGAQFITGSKSPEEAQEDLAASQKAQAEATNRLAAASERAQARAAQKQMSAPTQGGGSNFLGFAKDMGKVGWNMVKNNRKAFYAAGTAGALAAGMKYGVNKYIQRDMRKNNISMNQIAGNRDRQRYLAAGATPEQIEAHELQQQQRSYSILPLTTVATTAMSEVPTIAGYFGQRKQILKQRKMQAQLDRHAAATRQQQPAPVQPRLQQPQQAPVPGQQRTYSFASNKFIQSAFNSLKSVKPKSGYSFGKRAAVWGGKALDFGASLMGGGKGIVKSTGNLIKQQGQKSGNQWTQNAGNWIMNNQKKALLGSIGVGALMARGVAKAGKLGYKATDKALRAVDRNAYEYTDVMSGAVPRQQQYPNQQ